MYTVIPEALLRGNWWAAFSLFMFILITFQRAASVVGESSRNNSMKWLFTVVFILWNGDYRIHWGNKSLHF